MRESQNHKRNNIEGRNKKFYARDKGNTERNVRMLLSQRCEL